LRYADGETDIQTYRHADRNTTHPYWRKVKMESGLCSSLVPFSSCAILVATGLYIIHLYSPILHGRHNK